jgi:hypothetical protein
MLPISRMSGEQMRLAVGFDSLRAIRTNPRRDATGNGLLLGDVEATHPSKKFFRGVPAYCLTPSSEHLSREEAFKPL